MNEVGNERLYGKYYLIRGYHQRLESYKNSHRASMETRNVVRSTSRERQHDSCSVGSRSRFESGRCIANLRLWE